MEAPRDAVDLVGGPAAAIVLARGLRDAEDATVNALVVGDRAGCGVRHAPAEEVVQLVVIVRDGGGMPDPQDRAHQGTPSERPVHFHDGRRPVTKQEGTSILFHEHISGVRAVVIAVPKRLLMATPETATCCGLLCSARDSHLMGGAGWAGACLTGDPVGGNDGCRWLVLFCGPRMAANCRVLPFLGRIFASCTASAALAKRKAPTDTRQ
ncbi:hypothetical protein CAUPRSCDRAFT_11822 [Caulochytrium protostelioides]|uniref:Uncharacterized protein n=1 Tax=Caulochytrium protostelioides TaxID=1555241 RepID=A0A4P9WVF2_9FUNG|nr:hypothetical protein CAUPRSCDRAFT_11822 [Caulochytrium protostelioides]